MSTTRSFQKIKRPPRKARAGMLARAIDAAVELVNPAAGARRAFDRMAAARAHDAAERTRGSATRKKIRKSPDRQLAEDLEELREVSRDLVRNDGHAQAVLDKRVEHVVGSTGLHPMPQATAKETGLDPETVREWNEACLSVFQQWATHWADATMHDTFAGLQGLMVRSKDRDGECFIHFVRRPLSETRELGLCLELVEPERIANPDGREDDEKFRQGVELDEFGGAKRYHVLVHHPDSNYTGSGSTETRAIDAFRNGRTNTIHWFDRTEIGQHRGRPLLSSVLSLFENLKEWFDSEMTAARIAANIAMVVKRTASGAAQPPNTVFDNDEGKYVEEIEAGQIHHLEEGEEMDTFNPQRPGNTWEPFVVRILRAIATAAGMSYEMLTGDLRGANYSSMRTSLLEMYRAIGCQQAALRDRVCHPIYARVIEEAYLRGMLPRVGDFKKKKRALCRAAWMTPPRGWVDPTKEVKTTLMEIQGNLSTHTEAAGGLGRNFQEIARAKAAELAFLREVEKEHDLPEGSLHSAFEEEPEPQPQNTGENDEGSPADTGV